MIKRMRKGRLFWRLMLSIWAACIFFLLGSGLILSQIAARNIPPSVVNRIENMIMLNARAVLTSLEYESKDNHQLMINHIKQRPGFQLFLYNSNGDAIITDSDDGLARQLLNAPKHNPSRKHTKIDQYQKRMVYTSPLDYKGKRYNVIAFFELPPSSQDVIHFLPTLWPVIALSVLIAGLFSAIAAHWVLAPIQLLQTKTRAFTNGDWKSRIGTLLAKRRDEFSDLGQDFDTMASHIESLINGQRRLLRDISHELRSPLARVRIALALMENPDQVSKGMVIIERNANKLDELIGEILMLARLEHNEFQLMKEDIDLVISVKQVIDRCQIEAQQKQQQFVSDLPVEEIGMQADSLLIQRAIENILRNAISHTPDGTQIFISLNTVDEHAVLTISDTGNGVDKQTLQQLFDPFFRADNAHHEGTGLGLAIAKRAIELHRGTIAATSGERTAGLSIELRLPL